MQRITNWKSEESDEIGISIYDQSTGKPSPAIGKQSFSRNWEILEIHLFTIQPKEIQILAIGSTVNFFLVFFYISSYIYIVKCPTIGKY